MQVTYEDSYRGYPIMTDEEANQGCDTEILDRHIERTEDMTGRHNKVLGFRIDLDYRSPVTSKKSIQDISNTIARTKKYFDRKGIDTSFTWRQEESKQTLPHGHVAVMVDGNKLMAPGKVVDKVKENWKRQAGEDNSRIFICEGSYRMRRNDPDFKQVKDEWIHRTSYLAKERDRGNTPDRHHEHGGTRVKQR